MKLIVGTWIAKRVTNFSDNQIKLWKSYLSLHKNKFTGRFFPSRSKKAKLLVFFLQAFPDSWLPEELETVVYHGGSARTYVGASSKQLIRIHHPFV